MLVNRELAGETLKKCYGCAHINNRWTCPMSLCDLNHQYPCAACGVLKYEGEWAEQCMSKLKVCQDFEKGE